MESSRVRMHMNAPPAAVYTALTETNAVARWRTFAYRGRFVELHPHHRIVEVIELETSDPALQGESTVTFELTPVGGGTDVVVTHDRLPPGLSRADNERGWHSSLAKLEALVEP